MIDISVFSNSPNSNVSTNSSMDRPVGLLYVQIKSNQIKSHQIYLPAQNIKEKQLKNIQTMNASRTQRQRDCSYTSPKE